MSRCHRLIGEPLSASHPGAPGRARIYIGETVFWMALERSQPVVLPAHNSYCISVDADRPARRRTRRDGAGRDGTGRDGTRRVTGHDEVAERWLYTHLRPPQKHDDMPQQTICSFCYWLEKKCVTQLIISSHCRYS